MGRKAVSSDQKKSVICLRDTGSTDFNLTITRQTVSRILRNFDMVSYVATRKPRITPAQRRTRVAWCYEHLSWSVNDWSNVVFMDESNYEIFNRKNRIYICRFRHEPTRFEPSQRRVHRGGGIINVSHKFIYLTYPLRSIAEIKYSIFCITRTWGYNFVTSCTVGNVENPNMPSDRAPLVTPDTALERLEHLTEQIWDSFNKGNPCFR